MFIKEKVPYSYLFLYLFTSIVQSTVKSLITKTNGYFLFHHSMTLFSRIYDYWSNPCPFNCPTYKTLGSVEGYLSKASAAHILFENRKMSIIHIFGCVLLVSTMVKACARSCVLCVEPEPNPPEVNGSLILHYQDNSTHIIYYKSNTLDCRKNNLPKKKISKVELSSAKFILYSQNQWSGKAAIVSTIGHTWFSPGEINEITMVMSVKQLGCT